MLSIERKPGGVRRWRQWEGCRKLGGLAFWRHLVGCEAEKQIIYSLPSLMDIPARVTRHHHRHFRRNRLRRLGLLPTRVHQDEVRVFAADLKAPWLRWKCLVSSCCAALRSNSLLNLMRFHCKIIFTCWSVIAVGVMLMYNSKMVNWWSESG